MIFEWPGLVYHGMLSMTPPSLEFFFQIRLYMVYLHLRLAIFLYQWHCWSIFTVKNHFSYSKIFFNVKCWKIGYQSNIWSVLVFMTLSCYATNLTLFRIYSGTDTKLFTYVLFYKHYGLALTKYDFVIWYYCHLSQRLKINKL